MGSWGPRMVPSPERCSSVPLGYPRSKNPFVDGAAKHLGTKKEGDLEVALKALLGEATQLEAEQNSAGNPSIVLVGVTGETADEPVELDQSERQLLAPHIDSAAGHHRQAIDANGISAKRIR